MKYNFNKVYQLSCTVVAPLKHTHFGEIYKNVDMRGEVALLTRNVLIDAEDAVNSTTYGGHIKVNR
jgi:hypothetical protein